MRRTRIVFAGVIAVAAVVAAVASAQVDNPRAVSQQARAGVAGCQLNSAKGEIKHVI